MSKATDMVTELGGRVVPKGERQPEPYVLLERDGHERWVNHVLEQQYLSDGWTPVQRGAPLISTRVEPDGTRETVEISYERGELVVHHHRGRKMPGTRRIWKP